MIDSLPFASFGLVAVVFAFPLTYLLIRLIKESELYSWQDDIEIAFRKKWTGKPEDELYAWLSVRMEYKKPGHSERERKFIDRKIKQLDQTTLYSDVFVDCYGSMVDINSGKEILSGQ
jgi:hypothetical protein